MIDSYLWKPCPSHRHSWEDARSNFACKECSTTGGVRMSSILEMPSGDSFLYIRKCPFCKVLEYFHYFWRQPITETNIEMLKRSYMEAI